MRGGNFVQAQVHMRIFIFTQEEINGLGHFYIFQVLKSGQGLRGTLCTSDAKLGPGRGRPSRGPELSKKRENNCKMSISERKGMLFRPPLGKKNIPFRSRRGPNGTISVPPRPKCRLDGDLFFAQTFFGLGNKKDLILGSNSCRSGIQIQDEA